MKCMISFKKSEIENILNRTEMTAIAAGITDANGYTDIAKAAIDSVENYSESNKGGTMSLTKDEDSLTFNMSANSEMVNDYVNTIFKIILILMPIITAISNIIKMFKDADFGKKISDTLESFTDKWTDKPDESDDTDGIKIKGSVSGEVFIKSAKEYKERKKAEERKTEKKTGKKDGGFKVDVSIE